ncbi:MAG: hypothetical protein F6K14_08770 [Symploca sp. SIO2C1]|nr:hypothetical protein [Symploca sp. SIO2C1]
MGSQKESVVIKLPQPPKQYIDLGLLKQVSNNNSLREVAMVVGVTTKTLLKYRTLAYKYIPAYQDSCAKRFPEFFQRKQVEALRLKEGLATKPIYPDPPPFTQTEVDILKEIGQLYRSTIQGRRISDRQVIQILEANQQQAAG